jgi:hypothetical protein
MLNSTVISRSLIITGMHRSGTSLTASLLQSSQVDIGKNLLEGNFSNPRGHFEDLDFMQFHEQVLKSQGFGPEGWILDSQVSVPNSFLAVAEELIKTRQLKELWGWKDPRTTLFLNFWLELLPTSLFIFVYRNPWEVIDSLYRRGDHLFQGNPYLALQVWSNYNQALLNFYDHHSEQCILLNINSIGNSPTNFIQIVSRKLNLNLDVNPEIFDSSLLHQEVSFSHRTQIITKYFPEVLELYQALNQRANNFDNNPEIYQIPNYDNNLIEEKICLLQDWQQNSNLSRCMQSLTQQLHNSQSQLEVVSQQQQQRQEHLAVLQSQLHQALAELSHTQQQLEESQAQHFHTQQQLEESQAQHFHTQQQLEESQAQHFHTQQQLEESQAQLKQSKQELSQAQQLIEEYQTDLELMQKAWSKTQIKLRESHESWQKSQQEIQKLAQILASYREQSLLLRAELEKKDKQKEHLQEVIEAMKTSKFWQLRQKWFKIKANLGLQSDPEMPNT